MPVDVPLRIGTFDNCTALQQLQQLQHRDDAGVADALPGQAKHQGVELATLCAPIAD